MFLYGGTEKLRALSTLPLPMPYLTATQTIANYES